MGKRWLIGEESKGLTTKNVSFAAIKTRRMGQMHEGMLAGDILIQHPIAVTVFERMGIPLGMRNATLADVCAAQGIRPALLISLLHVTIDHTLESNEHLQVSDIPSLVNFLLCSHDYFSLEVTPTIMQLFDKIHDATDEGSIDLLKHFFANYQREVERHFNYERDVAFPYMIQLATATDGQLNTKYSIKEYKRQHNDIEDTLLDLKSLLIKFLPPMKAYYPLRRNIFLQIAAFGNDLNIHTCIEDKMLIPLVEKEEQRWRR